MKMLSKRIAAVVALFVGLSFLASYAFSIEREEARKKAMEEL